MIYFSVIGLKQVLELCYEKVTSIAVRQVMTGILFLLLLPNAIWIQNYVRNNLLYAQWHDNIPKELENESRRPELFAKPLHLAAKWIVQHSDSSSVILSRWKELSLWLDGRKVLEANTQISPDQFNHYLRDYNVKYIVTIFWWSAISEFEALFVRSERFIFLPVYRIGNVEVFEVKSKNFTYRESKTTLSDSSIGSLYDEALRLMENDPARSELILKGLAERTEGLGSVIIYLGVAKELAGQLDSATTLFKKFRELQQAGAYVEQASYHQEIIARIKLAESAVNPTECAERFHIVAINYWELGYRKQAMKMLIRSLEADPYFFPSLIFSALFSFQQGDTFSTTKYLEKARLLQPTNILVTSLNSIRRCIDSSKVTTSSIRRLELQFKIIDSYIAMGLRENAIDDLLEILREDPVNQKALSLIARMYELKRRFGPALQMYKRLVMANPTDTATQMKFSELSNRLQ